MKWTTVDDDDDDWEASADDMDDGVPNEDSDEDFKQGCGMWNVDPLTLF